MILLNMQISWQVRSGATSHGPRSAELGCRLGSWRMPIAGLIVPFSYSSSRCIFARFCSFSAACLGSIGISLSSEGWLDWSPHLPVSLKKSYQLEYSWPQASSTVRHLYRDAPVSASQWSRSLYCSYCHSFLIPSLDCHYDCGFHSTQIY